MAKDEPHNDPAIDFVEQLEDCLDRVRGDLKDSALGHLHESATPQEIEQAILESARQLAASQMRANEDSPPVLTANESKLFETINARLSPVKRARWDHLVTVRDNENLTDEEHTELISLGEELEMLNVQRLQAVDELARLKGVKFETVCEQLGIAPI